jgi:hypothetical protein
MTAIAQSVDLTRRSYQRHVAALLEEIERRRHRLMVFRANGALPAGLRDLKGELQAVRAELAATLAAGSH